MTAKDIISPLKPEASGFVRKAVEADMPVLDVLPRLLDSPDRRLGVTDNGTPLGIIDSDSMLEGLGRLIAARDDCSVIVLECLPEDFSASMIAHAVEDSDAHLVDMLTTPSEGGRLRITLRVRQSDPTPAVHSLERYDFKVVEAHGCASSLSNTAVAIDRLLSLQTLLNV